MRDHERRNEMTVIEKKLGIIHQAIEIERFGHDFYSSMRTHVKDKNGQKLISFLARFEVDHIKWLEEEYDRQLKKLDEIKEQETVDLSLLGKGDIFLTDEVPDMFKEFDPVKATSFAIDVEKRSVEFYEKNMNTTDDDQMKDLFKRLADFEKDHIEVLENNLDNLKSKGRWIEPPLRMTY
jgi:rubrerythrin